MAEKDATRKRATLDAEFEHLRSEGSLMGPAQLLAVKVFDMIAAEGSEKEAAIEALATALERSRVEEVDSWIRQRLGGYVARMDDSFVSLVRMQMFEHYVNLNYDERIGASVAGRGNQNLAALRARIRSK